MYGFSIHACIDLGSSFAVYASVDLDKSPDSQLTLFQRALTVFGHPTVVHSRVLDGADKICDEIELRCGHDIFCVGPHNTATQVDLCDAQTLHDLYLTDADWHGLCITLSCTLLAPPPTELLSPVVHN